MWKIVLKRRHRTAVYKKKKRGHRDIIWGFGASGCSYIALKMLESRWSLSELACSLMAVRKAESKVFSTAETIFGAIVSS